MGPPLHPPGGSLPPAIPFVGPETPERRPGRAFRIRARADLTMGNLWQNGTEGGGIRRPLPCPRRRRRKKPSRNQRERCVRCLYCLARAIRRANRAAAKRARGRARAIRAAKGSAARKRRQPDRRNETGLKGEAHVNDAKQAVPGAPVRNRALAASRLRAAGLRSRRPGVGHGACGRRRGASRGVRRATRGRRCGVWRTRIVWRTISRCVAGGVGRPCRVRRRPAQRLRASCSTFRRPAPWRWWSIGFTGGAAVVAGW